MSADLLSASCQIPIQLDTTRIEKIHDKIADLSPGELESLADIWLGLRISVEENLLPGEMSWQEETRKRLSEAVCLLIDTKEPPRDLSSERYGPIRILSSSTMSWGDSTSTIDALSLLAASGVCQPTPEESIKDAADWLLSLLEREPLRTLASGLDERVLDALAKAKEEP